MFMGCICISESSEAQKHLLEDAHCTRYTVQPRSIQMYQNLRYMYRWSGMIRHVGKYIENCLTCLQVKPNHQEPG